MALPRPARHARRLKSHRIARGVALGVTAVLALGVSGAAAVVVKLQGNVESASVSNLMGSNRPAVAPPDPNDPNGGLALNILLMGSDQRDGENAAIGGKVAGMRSDTTILLHLSADRKRADLVSIPRDLIVDIPACPRADGTSSKAVKGGMFNAAFAYGADSGVLANAAACALNTVEQHTGVSFGPTPNYIVIKFDGFTRMVDALGGIPICIPQDIDSPKADHLKLSAGQQVLDGATALSFARARYGIGDNSDTQRMGRQQQLLAAMVRTVESKELLTQPAALLQFLGAATSSIAASPDMASIPNLTGLAISLRGLTARDITFMTIPSIPKPSDKDRVIETDGAAAVWANLAADKPIAPAAAPVTPTPGATTPGATTPGAATAPAPAAPKTAGKDATTAMDVACG